MRYKISTFFFLIIIPFLAPVTTQEISDPDNGYEEGYSDEISDDELQEYPTPVGHWQTFDEETGEKKSIVTLWIDEAGYLYGKIDSLFRKPHEEQNPLCDQCEDEKKDQPIIGMEIIWDMERSEDDPLRWDMGYILDPKNGKTYKCLITISEDDQTLEVRGFIGFSLIGRTQTWKRLE